MATQSTGASVGDRAIDIVLGKLEKVEPLSLLAAGSSVLGAMASAPKSSSSRIDSTAAFDNSGWSVIFGNGNSVKADSSKAGQADAVGYAFMALMLLGALVVIKR